MTSESPNDLVAAPNAFGRLFGAGMIYVSSSPRMTFYKSTDRGATWAVSTVINSDSYGNAVAVDPTNENVIYIGGYVYTPSYRGAVFKTTNGGISWTEISSGLASSVSCLAADPGNPNRIYAGGSGLYRSDNGGSSWAKVADYSVASIVINGTTPDEIYIGSGAGVYFSSNRGTTWQDFNGDLPDKSVGCLALDLSNKIVYAGTTDGGVYRNSALLTLILTCGAGGMTSPPSGTLFYPAGTTVQITATPNAKYRFSGWTGSASGTANPLSVVINSNISITASFERSAYTLTTAAGEGGTTSPAPGSQDYPPGASAQIRAIPSTNYQFTGWTGDSTGTANPLNVTMDGDKSVRAGFLRMIYAPQDFSGEKRRNRSLLQSEYINRLAWNDHPDNENTGKFKLYLVEGGTVTLLAEVPAGTTAYAHKKVESAKEYTYRLTVMNKEGREGPPAQVTVK